jgi:hypothetical protein
MHPLPADCPVHMPHPQLSAAASDMPPATLTVRLPLPRPGPLQIPMYFCGMNNLTM